MSPSPTFLHSHISRSDFSNGTEILYINGWVRITACKDDMIHVQAGPTGVAPVGATYGVVKTEWADVAVRIDETPEAITLVTDRLRVVVRKNSFQMDCVSVDGSTIARLDDFSWDLEGTHTVWDCGEDEHFFGLGLQFHSFDQRGKKRFLKTNADPPTDNGMAHAVIPFFISTKGYGVLLNTEGYSEFDMAESDHSEYNFKSPDPAMDFYFFFGPTPREILAGYTELTGRAAMPPKWALGFWYRMPTQWNSEQTVNLAQTLRDHEIPCDVIGLEPGWMTHSYPCTFKWEGERFPDPAGYVEWMRENGFRVNLWEHAYVYEESPIRSLLEEQSCAADKMVWYGLVPDFTLEKTAEIFSDYHMSEHISIGVSGYKLDECDGADYTGDWFFPDDTYFPGGRTGAQMHNIFGFLYQKVFHEMYERLGRRTHLLVRANYTGAQRYSSCIYSDYYSLEQYIRATVNSGFSGIQWCPEVRQSGSVEDFARRSQLMFFSPMAMINAWNSSGECEPWAKGEEAEAIFKKYADLRMRLIPYIYSGFWKARETGVPFIRGLVVDYPDDEKTYGVDDQFMFGEAFMVAPISAGSSRDVYLPQGKWFDYWTDYAWDGGRMISYDAPIDRLPLFVKAGSIVPMYPWMNYVGERVIDEVEFEVYPGGECSFVLYDDDGETTGYLNGETCRVRVECRPCDGGMEITLGKLVGDYSPQYKSVLFRVRGGGLQEEQVKLALNDVATASHSGAVHLRVNKA